MFGVKNLVIGWQYNFLIFLLLRTQTLANYTRIHDVHIERNTNFILFFDTIRPQVQLSKIKFMLTSYRFSVITQRVLPYVGSCCVVFTKA